MNRDEWRRLRAAEGWNTRSDATAEALYAFLVAHAEKAHDELPPTMLDMAQAVNRSVSVVRYNLLKLEKQGRITRRPRTSRSVRIVPSVQSASVA